jgi:hypothetical protein
MGYTVVQRYTQLWYTTFFYVVLQVSVPTAWRGIACVNWDDPGMLVAILVGEQCETAISRGRPNTIKVRLEDFPLPLERLIERTCRLERRRSRYLGIIIGQQPWTSFGIQTDRRIDGGATQTRGAIITLVVAPA